MNFLIKIYPLLLFFKRDICKLKSRFTAQAHRCMLWIYWKICLLLKKEKRGRVRGKNKERKEGTDQKKKMNEKKRFAGP